MCQISVIVPIYNGEGFLEETIESIRHSSWNDLQIILVDDGSTDRSSLICKQYSNKYPNIVYTRKENGGIVSARNQGLKMASGKYVCFCDQDDLVEEKMYEKMLKYLEENQCDMAICGTSRYVNGEKIPLETFKDAVYSGKDIHKEIISPILFYGTDLGNPPIERWVGTIWKCMVKKELIAKYNITFRRYVDFEDDLLFFLDLLTHANKVCTLSYMGYNWRINLQSETYNWKYIRRFCGKYILMTRDIVQMLEYAQFDNDLIEEYKKYQTCTMMEQAIVNQGSKRNKKNLKEKIAYIKKMFYFYDFSEAASFRKHVWSSSVRKKVALDLLDHKLWLLTYVWLVTYKNVREHAIRNGKWFSIEKRIKAKVRK